MYRRGMPYMCRKVSGGWREWSAMFVDYWAEEDRNTESEVSSIQLAQRRSDCVMEAVGDGRCQQMPNFAAISALMGSTQLGKAGEE